MSNLDGIVAGAKIPPSYPDSTYSYSPSDDYPESCFPHRSAEPNLIYKAVRKCFAESRLDKNRYGTPEWNPLGEFIKPGGHIFILCNFVSEKSSAMGKEVFWAKCTHASVIRPVIDYALKAVGPQGKIAFGNAPIQGASWEKILTDTGVEVLLDFYGDYAPGQVEACDLRGQVITINKIGWQTSVKRESGNELYIDLKEKSLLENAEGNDLYRVSQYDPNETMRFQSEGKHIYAIHEKICSADLLISIPKLKTHQKVGVTCALKGCVGAIVLKQSLAHHRKGSCRLGGDEYPAWRPIHRFISELGDWVWSRNEGVITNCGKVVEKVTRKLLYYMGGFSAGSWSGNDTCWRMALDIARCVVHSQSDGSLVPEYTRKHLVITDGIIGGEGNGPLKPIPVKSGWVFFSRDPFAADYINVIAMGYDPEKIPLVIEASGIDEFPITDLKPEDVRLRLGQEELTPLQFSAKISGAFQTPRTWDMMEKF